MAFIQDSDKGKSLYVIFSSTQCKIGQFIRTVTRYEYNHTSISLDPQLRKTYSFARYRKKAPFYAGFVEESCKRFSQDGKAARIRVYKIPISDKSYEEISACLKRMKENSDMYIYNLVSAMCVPLNRRVRADGTFTCVEFAVYMMARYCDGISINSNRFWSIKALQEVLSDYLIYEGPYSTAIECSEWGEDCFLTDKGLISDAVDTLKLNSRLVARLCRRRFGI